MKLGELYKTTNLKKLDPIEATVDKMGDIRTVNLKSGGQSQVCDVTLREDNDRFTLTLWDDQIKMVKVNSKIRVENGYITIFKGKRNLNVGKFGKLLVLEF